jgi:hypothetical protein
VVVNGGCVGIEEKKAKQMRTQENVELGARDWLLAAFSLNKARI